MQVIDEQRVLDAVDDVDHLGIGPDTARITVALGEFEFARFVSLTALKHVGEELILDLNRRPDGVAIGPESVREAVTAVEFEIHDLLAGHRPLARTRTPNQHRRRRSR